MENVDKNNSNPIEKKILGGFSGFDYETELKKRIEQEMEEARKLEEKRLHKENYLIETDFLKLSDAEKFDKNTIYKVFNRKQKTETFVNGEQAQYLIKNPAEYVVMFDHRIIEN